MTRQTPVRLGGRRATRKPLPAAPAALAAACCPEIRVPNPGNRYGRVPEVDREQLSDFSHLRSVTMRGS